MSVVRPKPLAARVEPIASESLMSLVARAAQANFFPKLAALLAHAGVGGHPAFAPFTAGDQVKALASLLGVQPDEVAGRMHLSVPGAAKGVVGWAGLRMERRWIEAKLRRVSPASLEASLHHRLLWTHRALSFCPQSFERLIDSCPACHAALVWVSTWGPDRCERCRASLLEVEPKFVDRQLHARFRAASNLISVDPELRRGAQAALPATFLTWDAGELFSALVELGVAFEHPGEGRSSATADALKEGRIGLVRPQDIARGYEVLQDWPDSYGELVGRIWKPHIDQGASMALRDLGLLGRRFDSRQSDSALRRLLREHIAVAAERVRVPLKPSHLTHLHQPGASSAVGSKEASRLFNVAEPVLKRLVPDGACFLGGRLGRGGGARFDRGRLSASVERRRHALDPTTISIMLGVPAYCLPAFAKARLLRIIPDPDVACMAGAKVVYDGRSVERLVQRLTARSLESGETDMALAGVTPGLFAPEDWVDAFKACLTGAIVIEQLAERQDSLASRLLIDRLSAEQFLEQRQKRPGPARDLDLSPREVGLLLETSDVVVGELIQAGLLAASRSGRRWRIRLHDVMAFHQAYALGPEMSGYPAAGTGLRPLPSIMPRPPLSTRRVWVYERN